jgi:hypothetical protein
MLPWSDVTTLITSQHYSVARQQKKWPKMHFPLKTFFAAQNLVQTISYLHAECGR